MAIVKMKRLRLIGLDTDRDKLIKKLQSLGCVEISDQGDRLADPDWGSAVRRDESKSDETRAALSKVSEALAALDEYAPVKSPFLAPKPELTKVALFDDNALSEATEKADTIADLDEKIRACATQEARLSSARASLTPWEGLDLPLDMEGTKDVAVRFGVCPATVDFGVMSQELSAAVEESKLYLSSSDREQHYMVLLVFRKREEDAISALRSFGWSAATLRGYKGAAKENLVQLEAVQKDYAEKKVSYMSALADMGGCRQSLKLAYERLTQELSSEDAKSELLATDRSFYLEGWVTADGMDDLAALLSSYDCAYEFSEPVEGDDVPIKLKNNKLSSPLNVVTEMYSLPSYDGVDANPLMMPFFCLFYGIMFADMAYGLIMVIAALVVLKKAKPTGSMKNFMGLLLLCGIPTFIMGALTGGFFGDAPYQLVKMLNPDTTFTGLPKLFDPLNDTLYILIGAMILGFVQIMTGMIINFVMTTKEGHFLDALMDQGSWWLVFIGIGVGALTGFWWVAIAGVAALILTQGRAKPTLGGKLIGGIASLYDITGYFGDILSYSRLMALMLAGSVIAQVFNTLAAMPGNVIVFLLIFAVGHALNFGLNLLGCFVHDLRLQSLEFFGKFYRDGGRAFKPLSIKTKYYEIID